MKLPFWKRRLAATLMLAVVAAAFVAPAANAGVLFGHYRRWKPAPAYGYSARPVFEGRRAYFYERPSSGAAPFIAGLIGGAILGSALSNAHAHEVVAASYYDPYCGITFNSLDACRAHFASCHHPEVIRVVEGGRYTRDLCWREGGWQPYGGSIDFSYRSDGRRWNDDDRRGDRDDRDGRWNDRRDDRGWNQGDDRRWKDDRRDGGRYDRRDDRRDDWQMNRDDRDRDRDDDDGDQ